MIYLILKHVHSILRWLVLSGIIFVIIRSVSFLINPRTEGKTGQKLVSLTLSFLHTQVLLGIMLYLISPKVIFSAESLSNSFLRFYLVEHVSLMIIAAVLVTIGVVYSKKASEPRKIHGRLLIFFLVGLILIFIAIPWPWRALGGGWF